MIILGYLSLLAAGFALHLAHSIGNEDQKTIEEVFRNTGLQINGKYPRLVFKNNKEDYTLFAYKLPLGLLNPPRLDETLTVTLDKPVKVEMKNKLMHIRVFQKPLPTNVLYDWDLETPPNTIPIGYSLDGLITHNFDDIPHMAVAGHTRFGKTVFLKMLFAHLLKDPRSEFYIIDLKRLEFSKYRSVKQIKGIATDKRDATGLLKSISDEIDDTLEYFEKHHYTDIRDTPLQKRKYVIVDEGGQLDTKSHEHLEKIATLGGGVGYRLIFATQYNTGDIFPRQVKQNSDARISFMLPTRTASQVALDSNGAEQLEYPGRALFRRGELHLVQVPYIDDKEIHRRFVKDVKTTDKEKGEGGKDTFTLG